MQYKGLARASAHIAALVRMPIMDQLPNQVQDAFTIGTAVGVQLDTLGKYAGVIRTGFGPAGPITLDDNDFTALIQVAIIRNNAGSSLATIQDLLHTYFENQIFVFDYANMRMSYYINSSLGSLNLAIMFVTQGLLPKPMGVQLASVIYAPNIDSFFGFRTYTHAAPTTVRPFNDYAAYQMNWPWLTYADAIVI